jgi:hypothetical protein
MNADRADLRGSDFGILVVKSEGKKQPSSTFLFSDPRISAKSAFISVLF